MTGPEPVEAEVIEYLRGKVEHARATGVHLISLTLYVRRVETILAVLTTPATDAVPNPLVGDEVEAALGLAADVAKNYGAVIDALRAKLTSETEAREKAERRAYDFDLLYQATHLDLVAAEATITDLTRKLEAAAGALDEIAANPGSIADHAAHWRSERAREAHAALTGKEKS